MGSRLVAEALQSRRRRGRELGKLSVPSRASARRDGANHRLLHIAGLRFGLRDLIKRKQAAAIELVEV